MFNWKLYRRAVKTFFYRNKPFFAQLCPTNRCNLRCHYCQIWEEKLDEVDTKAWRTIIDKIDALGVAVVSFTGGEPMLRDDIFELIDYAKDKGLYVKITSNGTLPIEKYEGLLRTKIDNICISLDGIDGDDLPYSKVSPKILNVIQFIYSRRGSKVFYTSTTLTQRNSEGLAKLVQFMCSNFADCGVFVQPIVVGKGKLRRDTEEKVDVAILKEFDSILDPNPYILDCQRYYSSQNFQWGCKGGKLFFSIRSDGTFWVCQDIPTELNILDDNFFQKWKKYDFDPLVRNCSGCIYSCYFLTQMLFNPRYWIGFIKKYTLPR